jgi:4-hydroxybenzoate polyprenyltransferase
MGWAAAFGSLSPAAILLYLASIAWVVGYDTIYALQDIEDDEIAGIKSSARFFGRRVRLGVGICYGLALAFMMAAFILVDAGPLSFLGLGLFALHLAWQVIRIDRDDGAGALRLFRSNRDAGLILFAGMILDSLLRFL